MFMVKNSKKYSMYAFVLLVSVIVIARGYTATTIGTNVQSDGNFFLSGASSIVQFANGWRISQTQATTTQITVTDSGSNTVLIFDEN